jgi:SRSO17 transposase
MAGIPETAGFLTKPQIALEQIQAACAADLPRKTTPTNYMTQ